MKTIVNLVLVLCVVTFTGCATSYSQTEGGETEVTVGLTVKHKPAPKSVAVAVGKQPVVEQVTEIQNEFNNARSTVDSAKAENQPEVVQQPVQQQTSVPAHNSVANSANRRFYNQ